MEPTQDPQLRDPLSEVTRKERLYLLAISTIGITIEYTGLIPSEITTFGIRFGEADQNYLLIILALVITYFLVAFTLYAASDFLAWRLTFQTMIRESSQKQIREQAERGQSADQRAREEERERKRPSMAPKNRDGVSAQPVQNWDAWLQEQEDDLEEELRHRYRAVFFLTTPVSLLRAIFEFLVPCAVGIFTIIVLVF